MCPVIKPLLVMLLVWPSLVLGHAMQPASQVVQAVGLIHEEDYVLTNNYEHPSVFIVFVRNKDKSIADEWRTEKKEYKLLPNSKRTITIRFKVKQKRKLSVCTRLKEIGKNHEKSSIVSTLCSRIIIHSAS